MRHDIDGFIVDVEEASQALADGHERPVPGADVRVELQVQWHVAPSPKQEDPRLFLRLPVHLPVFNVLLIERLLIEDGVLGRRI